MDLVLYKKFIWQLAIGFVTIIFAPINIFFIYIFQLLFLFYIIYGIYYFKTKEKDCVRVTIDKNMETNGVNHENSFTINELKKDSDIEKKEKRKNQFFFLIGIMVFLIGLSLILVSRFSLHLIGAPLVIFGLVPLLQGAYGLYVK